MRVLKCSDMNLNLEIRQLASECIKRHKGLNYCLVVQLFKAKLDNLFKRAFKNSYRPDLPNWPDLEEWFFEACEREKFTQRLEKH